MAKPRLITEKKLKEIKSNISYNHKTGVFVWIKSCYPIFLGKEVGYLQNGYLTVRIKKINYRLKCFFNKWCEENDCKIDFHNIDNVKVETWIVRSDDDYEVKK